MMPITLPGITVAICTHGRPDKLDRALGSLARQAYLPKEILVVDNAPPDDAAREVVARHPGVRYVRESVAGLDFARNRALREAREEVVAFLDDDAIAEEGWTGAIAAVFAGSERIGACTGRIEPLSLETDGQRLFEANGGFSRGRTPIRLPADAERRDARLHGRRAPLIAWAVSVGSGCSLAVRRSAALALGGFDEALDLGAVLPGGGDHDMLWRVLGAGYEVVYQPDALAWHEHRREVRAAHDQIVGHQRALVAFLVKAVLGARGRMRREIAAFLAWRLAKPGARLVRRGLGRDPLSAPVLLRMWAHCWRGLVAYPAARRVARTRRAGARGEVPALRAPEPQVRQAHVREPR